MSTSDISVVSAANAAYAPHLAAMLHSLMSVTPGRIDFRFLHRPDLEGVVIDRLEDLCQRHGSRLQPVAVPDRHLSYLELQGAYPVEAWYRLLLPSLLPDLGRVLWLDADLLVLRSLRPLWQTHLAGHAVAAVPNAMMPHHWEHLREIGVAGERARYFNTGVMLLDKLNWLAQQDRSKSLPV